jgi:hypothetical protein
MTWGEQNTESEAFEQMDYALGEGLIFGIQQNYMQFLLRLKRMVIPKL